MDSFSTSKKFSMHSVHVFLQRNHIHGFVLAVIAGVILAVVVISLSYLKITRDSGIEKIEADITKTKNEISLLKSSKATLEAKIKAQQNAPLLAQQAALNAGGYSEQDIDYWRKQFEVFSLVNKIKLKIVGRGASQYTNSVKLTVGISLEAIPVGTKQAADVMVRTLDFLQLYGYVESFNGTEAIVHIKGKNNVSKK